MSLGSPENNPKNITRRKTSGHYEEHAKEGEYTRKVKDRETFQHLDAVDAEVIAVINLILDENNKLSIVDVGCGSGDRLQMILEKINISRDKIEQVVGLDYSNSMLEVARGQRYADQPVYDVLQEFDATTPDGVGYKGNLVLCLWTVVNNIITKRKNVFKNLAKMCDDAGYIMLDTATVRNKLYLADQQASIRSEHGLPDLTGDNIYLYKRHDGTVGSMRLMTIEESNKFVYSANLTYEKVFGFGKDKQDLVLLAENTDVLEVGLQEEYDALFYVLRHRKKHN